MNTESIELQTEDSFTLSAYVARPERQPKAGMVVLQEIFGVNAHIRSVAERWAAQGYLAVAPALFDRVRRGVELRYEGQSFREGAGVRQQIPLEKTLLDIKAAIGWLRGQGMRKVGVVGYCWGGSLAWLANTRLGADASASYYGGMIADRAAERNNGPAIFHFGTRDAHIPASDWARIQEAHPELPLYTYDADHGFSCDARAAFDPPSAALALERTLALFDNVLLQG